MKQHDPDFVKLCTEVMLGIDELTPTEVQSRVLQEPELLLIDVREDHEVQSGRCARARHLGRGILERDIAKLASSKDQTLVVYCGGGFRSALAAHNLMRMGYTQVFSMAGGIRRWRTEGHPISEPDKHSPR